MFGVDNVLKQAQDIADAFKGPINDLVKIRRETNRLLAEQNELLKNGNDKSCKTPSGKKCKCSG